VSYQDDMPVVSVRLPNALLAKIDMLVKRCNATEFGRSSRSAMMAELVMLGVQQLETLEPK
jgi:hypothetical protein